MSTTATPRDTRILVLDDETPIVTALLSTLREEGYEANGATTSQDALQLLRARRHEVLVTDLQLAETDGIAVVRQALEIDPGLITIVMTGHGSIDTAVDAMKAGAADYLLKPFKLRTLQTVINRSLALRRLRHENESLQQRLLARTHELEATNKELEAFAYSVSHDLRAPLRAITRYSELFSADAIGGRPEELNTYADGIRRNAARMNTMIEDMLRMGRAMRSELKWQPVDLASYCTEIAATKKAQGAGRQVAWQIPDRMPVWGDPGLLSIVMENLLDNAWKYSARRPDAAITLRFALEENEARVAVTDNGVGFDQQEAIGLFAPFSRLRSAAGFEGTGIGLATVQRIIHRHGGRIWAESQPGQGATFFFTVPRGNPTSGQPLSL